MNIEMIRETLLWCSAINAGLLLVWFTFFVFAHEFTYSLHNKWYPMPKETFNAIHYAGMALFKVLVLVFNVVPYVALTIIR